MTMALSEPKAKERCRDGALGCVRITSSLSGSDAARVAAAAVCLFLPLRRAAASCMGVIPDWMLIEDSP
jgi:hypothetical protein